MVVVVAVVGVAEGGGSGIFRNGRVTQNGGGRGVFLKWGGLNPSMNYDSVFKCSLPFVFFASLVLQKNKNFNLASNKFCCEI